MVLFGKLFNKGSQFLPQAQGCGIDVNNVLASYTTYETITYVAQQDCWVIAQPNNEIYIDNVFVSQLRNATFSPMFIKKGQTLKVAVGNGTIIYGIKY